MKVIAINGSPRANGNTAALIRTLFEEFEKHGAQCEEVRIGGRPVRGCMACNACFKNRDERCIVDDGLNELIQKMKQADVIIVGSPTYFTDVTAEMKAFIDRSGFVSVANGGLFKRKIGAAVVAVRRGGATHVFDTLNHYLHYQQVFMPGSTYWNMGYGLKPGDVAEDEEGLRNMRNLAENIIWLHERIK